MTLRTSIFDRLDNSPVRGSIERLAECAPVATINSVVPCHHGADCGWPACSLDCDGRPGNPTRKPPVIGGVGLGSAWQHPVPDRFFESRNKPYIDDTPVMLAAHAAIEAEGRATAIAVVKLRARHYALEPRQLDAILPRLSCLPAKLLVYSLAEARNSLTWVSAINLRGAMLYARYLRAKARQIARRAA